LTSFRIFLVLDIFIAVDQFFKRHAYQRTGRPPGTAVIVTAA
jgi:hypothetical protein